MFIHVKILMNILFISRNVKKSFRILLEENKNNNPPFKNKFLSLIGTEGGASRNTWVARVGGVVMKGVITYE